MKTCRSAGWFLLLLATASGCADPYSDWPEQGSYFPWVYTPESGLEDFEKVRFETETWDPEVDSEITSLYVQKALYFRPGAPQESLEHFAALRPVMPALSDGPRLSLVGDIMWIESNWDAFALPVAHLLDGDLRVGNLETPTSPLHTTDRDEMGLYQINAPVELLDGLPLDVLQLNNNHSIDFGDEGLEATLAAVQRRGYTPTGVDSHAVMGVGGIEVALLSYTWGVNRRDISSAHELFIIPFGHITEVIDLTPLREDVRAARLGSDTVVVLLHWGFEFEFYPDPHFMVLAREIISAGADLVVGHGPHVIQPAEICHVNRPEHIPGVGTCSVRDEWDRPRTAAVLYSLGNFSTFLFQVPIRSGLLATVSLNPDVTGLGWTPTIMFNDPQAHLEPLADHLDDPELAAESDRLDTHLGTGWKRR
jgi:poly-gamma-glutamate synthesis protein (capsule biosynthesis protein)